MGNMRVIKLTKGYQTIVDDEDYDSLIKHNWCYADGYAVRGEYTHHKNGKTTHKTVGIHRYIMNAPNGMEVDHRDGNKLDNRKQNLRICKQADNARNKSKLRNNSSGYIGVSWHKNNKKWGANARLNKKLYCLGYFSSAFEAAKVRDSFVRVHFNGFGRLNFP